jgi:hypothetical protein
MKHIKLFEQFVNEAGNKSPYIRNGKVAGKVYHVAGTPIKALTSDPMWFALEKEHSDDGWYKNTLEYGEAYQYSAKIRGKVGYIFERDIEKLFEDNDIDADDWMIEIVGNPDAEYVMALEGTKLLIKNGYDGIVYPDYDPRDFQADLDALIVFNAKKNVKSWKLEKSQ